MTAFVGIDFGTSNSTVASVIDGKNQVIPDERGQRLTPSVVSFGKDNQILIGSDAKTQGMKNPKRTIHSIKRLIGRKIYSAEVQKAKVLLPYELVEGENQNVAVKIEDKVYAPQEIATLIIKHMKEVAERGLGEMVSEAVVTVPAYFNNSQRQATKEACEIAGLNALRMVNEPTAAALAYGFGKSLNETTVVYDLGGGTFYISILRLKDKVFEVIATAGDTFLGGDDFDDRVMDIIADDFLKKTQIDLRSIPQVLPLLRSNAEKTKRRLSYAERSDIYIPEVLEKEGQKIDLHFTLSRDQLKEQSKDLIQRTFAVCDEALNSASIKASNVDAVILVGGPTKMPLIYEAVQSYFGKPPLNDLNPDEVVSIGASIQANSLKAKSDQKKALLLDVTPLDLGIATVDGYIETLIEKNSPIPVEATKSFTTTSDNQKEVDIRIFQGKNRREEESHLLGEFKLTGFQKKRAGDVNIDVNFSINTDGIVQVAAVDKETGVAQKVSVKLSASMGEENIRESVKKTKQYKEVQMKDKWENATRVLIYKCGESLAGSGFAEGYIQNFSPELSEFQLLSENKSEKEKHIPKNQVAWICLINDFSNIPRYLKAIGEKPHASEKAPSAQLYEFILSNGEKIYGQADLPKVREEGFWMEPYFPHEDLTGKVFVYSGKIKESNPIQFF